MFRIPLAGWLSAAFLTCSLSATAGSVFNVDLSSYFNNDAVWNPPVQAGVESGTGSTSSGLSFVNTTGQFIGVGNVPPFSGYYSASVTILTGDSNVLSSNVEVNTLINLINGSPGYQETLIFTNSNSDTDTFTLVDGETVRDYHDNNNGGDGLTGSSAGVTAVNWWNDGTTQTDGQPQFRLDAQIFVLPSSWAGTTLTSLEVVNYTIAGAQQGDTALSALQIDDLGSGSTVPEPSTLLLLGAGLIAVRAFKR
jgi:PEP-CTERM motif